MDIKTINSTLKDENSNLLKSHERVIGEKDWELSSLLSVKEQLEADKHYLKKQRDGLAETNLNLCTKVDRLKKMQAGFIKLSFLMKAISHSQYSIYSYLPQFHSLRAINPLENK